MENWFPRVNDDENDDVSTRQRRTQSRREWGLSWCCCDGVRAEVRCQPAVDIHRTSRMKSVPKHVGPSRSFQASARIYGWRVSVSLHAHHGITVQPVHHGQRGTASFRPQHVVVRRVCTRPSSVKLRVPSGIETMRCDKATPNPNAAYLDENNRRQTRWAILVTLRRAILKEVFAVRSVVVLPRQLSVMVARRLQLPMRPASVRRRC